MVALPAFATPKIILPVSGLVANDIAVVVNTSDPLSVKIAEYYQQQRQIPAENIIRITFDPGKPKMHPGEFAVLQKLVEAQIPSHIQAFALTWAEPYRVGCMSISSAFALGYSRKYCAKGCKPTAQSMYVRSSSLRPYDDLGIRPTMLLAAENFADAKALIDRGVAADKLALANVEQGTAYLVTTADKNRNVRKLFFPEIKQRLGRRLPVELITASSIQNRRDVMFYFTGAVTIPDIDSNQYLPGAMADHLTSTGGKLTDSYQMSALRWLEAGVTGSYGTVVEPCNLLGKFPNPAVAMKTYLEGASLLEAYWKSVAMPGQGVFIGEPLASPYRHYSLKIEADTAVLSSPVLQFGHYKIWAAETSEGPFTLLHSGIEINHFNPHIRLAKPLRAVYKIERLEVFGKPSLPLLID